MTYSSPEVLQLEAIRDWMDTLDAWTDWAGEDRVVWPIKAAPDLPVCVLGLNSGRTVNLTGAAGGSNFQPSGSITLWIYAADDAPTDPQLGYSNFADKFYGLISAMADVAHQAPVLFNEFSTPDSPIVHSTWIMTEDESEGLAAYWQGQITIRWGVEA
jgi:hypothetical protein